MNANTTANVDGTKFPADGSRRQKLGHAVKCAIMAAPMDARQPWEFRARDEYIELSTDPNSPVTDDSDDRKLMIQCGVALFRLKLTLKHFGCLGPVELFPNLARADLVAKIHFGSGRVCRTHESGLFEAMSRHRNSTTIFGEMPVDESTIEMLRFGVAGEKAWLEFCQCELSRNRLAALAQSNPKAPSVGVRSQTQPNNSRMAQWTRPLLTFIVRTSDSRNLAVELSTAKRRADEMTALAAVKTKTDDRHGWLATGQAIARATLQAGALEISSRVFDQNFEHRLKREELRTTMGHKGFVQAIIGFGSRSARPSIFQEIEPVADPRSRSATD
jgi:hypothetical protein